MTWFPATSRDFYSNLTESLEKKIHLDDFANNFG